MDGGRAGFADDRLSAADPPGRVVDRGRDVTLRPSPAGALPEVHLHDEAVLWRRRKCGRCAPPGVGCLAIAEWYIRLRANNPLGQDDVRSTAIVARIDSSAELPRGLPRACDGWDDERKRRGEDGDATSVGAKVRCSRVSHSRGDALPHRAAERSGRGGRGGSRPHRRHRRESQLARHPGRADVPHGPRAGHPRL
jgi:hypothetical protein